MLSSRTMDHASLPLIDCDDMDDAACAAALSPRLEARGHITAEWRDASAVDAPLIAAWRLLDSMAGERNVFCESWFMVPALTHCRGAADVRLFLLWQDEPAGRLLLGLMALERRNHYGARALPHWHNWVHPNAFLGAPLICAGAEELFWRHLLAALDARPEGALFAHMMLMDDAGATTQALHSECARQRRGLFAMLNEKRALLSGALSPTAYFEQAVRGKKRKELRRQHKRLAELGALRFERQRDDQGLDDWIDAFLALERRGWKGANGSALACGADTAALFRAALHGAAAAGKLERLSLHLDGVPIAMLVNFLSAPGSFAFKTAYDEAYARFSPGVLLQIHNLDLLQSPDITWCDSCAVEGHPMIDSLWTDRRTVTRLSLAIGGGPRRTLFAVLARVEQWRMARRAPQPHKAEYGHDRRDIPQQGSNPA